MLLIIISLTCSDLKRQLKLHFRSDYMIVAVGNAIIKDKEGETEYNVSPSELDWQAVEITEREMGREITWQATIEHEALGDLAWTVWEYPENSLNSDDVDIDGHQLIENFSFEFFVPEEKNQK